MKSLARDEFKDNMSHYKKTIWIRLPGLVLVGSILWQHAGVFHYVGMAFISWAIIELAAFIYGRVTKTK